MIISHLHKFIYMKSVKTASTSVEAVLARECGSKDVLTTIDPPVPGHSAANNDQNLESHCNLLDIKLQLKLSMDKPKKPPYPKYYKFMNVRNPWDRAVSYYYHYKESIACSFDDWLIYNYTKLTLDEPNKRTPHLKHWYNFKTKYILDGYIRYEYLEYDLKTIYKQIGIKYNKIDIPKHKLNKDRIRDYKKYYNKNTADIIYEGHIDEIIKFNYMSYHPFI